MDLRAFAAAGNEPIDLQSLFAPTQRGEYQSTTLHRVQTVPRANILQAADLLKQTDEKVVEALFSSGNLTHR